MSAGHYLAGACFLAVTLGASGLAAETVRRRRLLHLTGAERACAQGLLTASAAALAVLLPGALGILTRGTMTAAAVLLAAAASVIRSGPLKPTAAREQAPIGRVSRGVAVLSMLAAGTWFFGELLHTVRTPFTALDFTSYDLPVIGRWIQTGSLWRITELFPLQTHGTYPQNGHLVIAAAVLAFHNDALVRFLVYPFLLLAAAAVYATASELGAARSTAVVFAAMVTLVPSIALDLEAGPPDTIALAAFAVGVLFLVRRARTEINSDLVLAGLGLGFAAGSLWYYSSAVVVLALVWAGWRVAARRRRAAREVAVLVGLIAACSAFWLIRNWIGAGDPVYPVRVAIGSLTIFGAPHDVYRAISGFSIANYSGNPSVLRHYIGPALGRALGVPGLIVLLGFVAAAAQAVAARGRSRIGTGASGVLLVAAPLLAVVYVLTPYSAFGVKDHPTLAWVNVRYLLPGFTVALALAAGAVARARPRVRTMAELAGLAAGVQGAHEAYHLLGTTRASIAAGAAIALAAAAAVWIWQRAGIREARPPRLALGTAAVAVAGVFAIGYGTQRSLNHRRYAAYDATYAWIQDHPKSLRIGLAGSWNFAGVSPAWAMFGARLQNRVSFVGLLHHDHLTQYQTAQAWLGALRRGHYALVEIARNAPEPAISDAELRWAALARLPVVSASSRFELVRVGYPGGR